jgi:hypothetical protein
LEKNHEEFQMYSQYNTNAETRYKAIQSLIKEGDKRAIDSVEAGSFRSRQLLRKSEIAKSKII